MCTRYLYSALLLMTIAFGGCGRGDEPPEIVLRVTNWGSPAVESSFMKLEREILEEFERRHPGVTVQVEQIPDISQYAVKVILMQIAGSPPDVVHMDASCCAAFIDNNVLRDLTPLIDDDGDFDESDYFEKVLKIGRRGGALYAIPLDFTPMVMYYNKELFEKARVTFPREGWTWDEFLAAAKALTISLPEERRPAQYGCNFENIMPFWVPWLWANGGDVLDPTGTSATGNFDSPASQEAVEFLTDLILEHRVAPSLSDRAAMGGDPFLNGKAAMDLKGHWMLIDYRARGLDVGVATLPTNTGKPVTVVYECGLAIMRDSPHHELAWEYIKYMTSEEVQKKRVASGLAISGNRRAAAHFAGNPVEDAFLKAVEYARPPWGSLVENYPLCEQFGEEMMKNIIYGEGNVPLDQSLRDTARLMDSVLAHQ